MRIKTAITIFIVCLTFYLLLPSEERRLPKSTISYKIERPVSNLSPCGLSPCQKIEEKENGVFAPGCDAPPIEDSQPDFTEAIEPEPVDTIIPEPPTRNEVFVEPPPDWIAEAQRLDSVDVMEIELTDYLLSFDISDRDIDHLFMKIRGQDGHFDDMDEPSESYARRLREVTNLIRETEFDSHQLMAALNDIFPE